jgi:membrane associated rhomboid family serine protease
MPILEARCAVESCLLCGGGGELIKIKKIKYMIRSIWEDVKREFSQGNMVTRLIIINSAIWILINIIKIFLSTPGAGPKPIYTTILQFFCFSSNIWHNLKHPWTLLTAGFLHEDFSHILWNMLGIYWFGRIVGDLLGNRRVLPLYILGTVAGLMVYFFVRNFSPYSSGIPPYALGASAAMMAMTAAAATVAPDYLFNILFVGPVKLKYLAALTIFLNMISIAENANTGGSFAHLGGAIFGWFFVRQLQQGNDLGQFVYTIGNYITNLFTRKSNPYEPKVTYRREKERSQTTSKADSKGDNKGDNEYENRLNMILDKIKESGYDSLTPDEKEFLFRASGKS